MNDPWSTMRAAQPPANPMAPKPNFLKRNSDAMLQAGIGLLTGANQQQQIAMGGAGFLQGRQAQQERLRQQQEMNKTVQYLQNVNPDMAAAVQAGMPVGDAFKLHMQQQMQANQAQSPARYGNPERFTRPDGTEVWGMFGSDGSFKEIDSGGLAPSDPYDRVDAGTHYKLIDKRTGTEIGQIPKENYEAASDKAAGTAAGKRRGEAQGDFEDMKAQLPNLTQVVGELRALANIATYTYAGQAGDFLRTQSGMDPSEGAVARTKYEAMVNNQILPLLRQTFGAQFTVAEGESLRATLGAPNKTPREKQEVLDAFINQKVRDLQAKAQQAGIETSPAPAGDIDALIDQYAD